MATINCVPASFTMFKDIPDPRNINGVLKFLEGVGRTCYKSEDKITDTSCVDFVEKIRNRKHWAMLEHYHFCLEIDEEDYNYFQTYYTPTVDDSNVADKMRYIKISMHMDELDSKDPVMKYYVSGSATALNYLLEAMIKADRIGGDNTGNMNPSVRINEYMHSFYPMLFIKADVKHDHDGVEDPGHCPGRKNLRIMTREEIRSLPIELRRIHDFMSFRIITDRGVTHEIVRHRPFSFGQESTRYCNYGSKGFQFIIPCWFMEHEKNYINNPEMLQNIVDPKNRHNTGLSNAAYEWVMQMKNAADTYEHLTNHGWTPQEARSVLPNAVKTEIVCTAPLMQWEHFFEMRVPKSAHPQMREIAIPMLDAAVQYDSEVFLPLKGSLI